MKHINDNGNGASGQLLGNVGGGGMAGDIISIKRTQGPLVITVGKPDWKEELQTRIDNCILYNWQGGFASKFLLEYTESILEEQRKEVLEQAVEQLEGKVLKIEEQKIKQDLINQILNEAPDDRESELIANDYCEGFEKGFNKANMDWCDLLTKHLI